MGRILEHIEPLAWYVLGGLTLSRRSRRLLVLFASIRGADEIVGLLGKERAMHSRRSVIVFAGASGRLVGWRDPFAER